MTFLEKTYKSLQSNYNFDGIVNEHTPVNVNFLEMPDNKVIINKEVIEEIKQIGRITFEEKKEIGFILYGKEFEHNKVYINNISISDGNLDNMSVIFGDNITKELETVIDENLDVKTVVVHSHSHPDISNSYKCFSLGDLSSYLEFTLKIEDFKVKNMQLIGCLLTDIDNLKFIYYNPYDDNFYEMKNIIIE